MAEVTYLEVPGFPFYRAGSDGSVWSSKPRGGHGGLPTAFRKLKQKVNKRTGYCEVTLYRSKGDPVSILVHRVVLLAFRGFPEAGMECRHLNGKNSDNNLDNLMWGTKAENTQDKIDHGKMRRGESSGLSKIRENDVREIRAKYATGELTQCQIAQQHDITQANVSEIVRMKTWKHLLEKSNA